MGGAYFIVLERKVEGLDIGMDGKGLSRNMDELDAAAHELGVRPLSEFFSADPEQMAEFMESEGLDSGEFEPPQLQQFSAQEGLATVRALAKHAASQLPGVSLDLQECDRILTAATLHGVGWHFEIDF